MSWFLGIFILGILLYGGTHYYCSHGHNTDGDMWLMLPALASFVMMGIGAVGMAGGNTLK